MSTKEGGSGMLYCCMDKMTARAMSVGAWDAYGVTITDFKFYDSNIADRIL